MFNVLYVEDDLHSREVLRMVQRMNPELFELVVFDDSQDFESRLSQLEPQPDLILLDIHVQPYSGFDMLERLRSRSEYVAKPIVALTASVMNEEIEKLQTAGFHSVVSKPLNMDEFPNLVRRIMGGEQIWYVW